MQPHCRVFAAPYWLLLQEPDAAPATLPPQKILHQCAAAGELSVRHRYQLKFAVELN